MENIYTWNIIRISNLFKFSSRQPWETTSGAQGWWRITSGENSVLQFKNILYYLKNIHEYLIIGIFNISHCCSKKFGPGWNAVVGEAYSFEISYTKWVLFLSGFKLLFKTSCPSSSLIWFKEIHIAGERWCTCTLADTWVYVSGKQIDICLSYQ